jgi:flagellar hook-associated protein 1 FlgK
MGGLFSTLNTADLGMSAMQSALNVTSHNVANADTAGYTRETVNLQALAPTNPSLGSSSANEVGTGVTVEGISRIRNVLNDYQLRQATSANSTLTTTSSYLSQIQTIMNEPSDTGISSLIGTFFSNWSSLAQNAGQSSDETTVAQGAQTLTDALNNVYNQLQSLKTDCQTSIQTQIASVNTQLSEADNLNQQIMAVTANGGTPNDLMDQRDLLLDNISQSFDETTTGGNLNSITLTVGTTNPTATTSSTATATLISPTDPSSESRLVYISSISGPATDGSYDITYYKNGDTSSSANQVTINVTATPDQISQLEESRVLVTDQNGNIVNATTDGNDGTSTKPFAMSDLTTLNSTDGVLQGLTQSQQNIDKYTTQLNNVAKAIALAVNTVESGQTDETQDNNPFFVNSSDATYGTDSSGNVTLNSTYTSGITANEEAITAGNISVNTSILDNPALIQAGSGTSGTTDGTRALAIANLGNLNLDIQGISSTDGRSYFGSLTPDSNNIPTLSASSNGTTCSDYFTNTITNLGGDTSEAQQNLTTQTSVVNALTQTRTSVSGVSTDEEMTNLIQYQHAYEANAKIISTVDELLGVVINNLKTS